MKKKLPILLLVLTMIGAYLINLQTDTDNPLLIKQDKLVKKKKKTQEERMLFVNERLEHEFNLQKNPVTGEIPLEEKQREYQNAALAKQKTFAQRTTSSTYVSRGPSNLGGRTRAMAVDISDATSNTILAGGVSSGLFRTTDGGASWTKVSANDEIHNVTALAQDPRAGSQNIWYYATGERLGNSASLGAFNYFGNGVWKSTDNGLTWAQITETSSDFTTFDSRLDLISAIEVSPVSGDLIIAATAKIYRYDGTTLTTELDQSNSSNTTDVVITSSGRVFAAFDGRDSQNGVWTSLTGNGSWTRIAQNGNPTQWSSAGRIVLGASPSNDEVIYALYANGDSGNIEADIWKYTVGTDRWTDFSSKLPDEPGGDLSGNDPFAVQGGYDLVVSVKPDNENFLVIGGTNAYKIEDVVNDATFTRIGGYVSNSSYGLYNNGGVDHHPDVHALVFDPNNSDVLFSGTDGGVHKTTDINDATISWENLNNNYQTYQFYHVAIDPLTGGNLVIGGAQDNGTKFGGTDVGLPDNTSMSSFAGGDGVAVAVARRNSEADIQLYAGTQNGNMFTNYPSPGRSLTPSGSSSQFITYFYLDPDNNDNLYYAGESVLFKTNDAENVTTSSWENLGALPVSQNIRTFATTRGTYNASSSYLLIGGERGGVFRLNDPKNSTDASDAINITPSGASTTNGTVVSGLAIHPTNPDIVLAVYANYGIDNIFLTTDATSNTPTWTLVERNLSAHSIRSAAIVELAGETIYYVGTGRGLYSTNDPLNNDWDIEGSNEIGFAVVSGLVLRPSDNKLLIGTHGNGMYETTVEGTLSVNNETKGELGLSLYPNPTVSALNIKINNNNLSQEVKYQISDVTGRLVMQGVVKDRKVNVELLNSGIYIINLAVDGKRQSSKFIKN